MRYVETYYPMSGSRSQEITGVEYMIFGRQ
jgi:hypothetical protein